MYSYISGKIVDIQNNHIVVDNQGMGYMLFVSNPYAFKRDEEKLIYVYQQVKEDDILLFGFETKAEKELFLKLILVKGIGCKTAIGILATGDIGAIISAIETSNVTYLKKIPGIGPKAAQQIILDLQGKFKGVTTEIVETHQELDEASEVLLALGYKKKDIDKVMATLLNEKLDTNGYVKKALGLLVK
ncbi:MAG: Holliday junction branch migration protein RuvA [Coprobacillaceae bacterium]